MTTDQAVVARLRAAGCVFAEDEARLLAEAARTPAELDALVQRRVSGLPLEQVVGWAEFHGLRIFVDPGVFVPRRRSEFLVDTAVSLARPPSSSMGDSSPPHGGLPAPRIPLGPPSPPGPVIVDLCCGTGALGLAVATALGGTEPSGTELHAADIDQAAVACARRNLEPAGGHVYLGDLFGPLPTGLRGRVGVLICNAPYVPSPEVSFLPPEARDYEPRVALDGGPDGLAVLRRVAAAAPRWLAPGGSLLVETSDQQAPAMTRAMTAAGLTARVHTSEEYGASVVTGSTLIYPERARPSPGAP